MTDAKAGFRIEHDSMGEVLVPEDALWGANTQRAVENFPVSGERLPRELIGALSIATCANPLATAGRQGTGSGGSTSTGGGTTTT